MAGWITCYFWHRIPDSFCVQDGPALSVWVWEVWYEQGVAGTTEMVLWVWQLNAALKSWALCCLCQSCSEMPVSSLEMTGLCPLKPFALSPPTRTQLPGNRPQAWKIMQMVMFNSQVYQTKSYSNSLEETLNRVCYPVTHATRDGFVFSVVGIQYFSQIFVLQDFTIVYK